MRRSRLIVSCAVVLAVEFAGAGSDAFSGAASDEFTISETRWDAGVGDSRYVAAASRDRFLIVWTDSSSGVTLDIRGLLVSAESGLPIGSAFTIADGAQDDSLPAAASDGTRFLVTWSRGGHGYASLVTPDGAVVDPEGLPLARVPSSLVWNGTDWIAAWAEFSPEYDTVYTAKLDLASGAMSDILTSMGGQMPGLATTGASLLTTATEDVETRCVGAILYPIGGAGCVSPTDTDSFNEGSATDGSDYLVVYGCEQGCEDPTSSEIIPRAYSIEIDGTTALPRPETRRAVTETGYIGADVAFAGGWLIASEGPGSPGPDIYVNETRMLPAASWPRIAVTGDTGLVIANRGANLVGRSFPVSEPPPTLIPPSPTPTVSPAATPSVPSPLLPDGASADTGCECDMSSTAETRPPWRGLAAAFLIAGIARVAFASSSRHH